MTHQVSFRLRADDISQITFGISPGHELSWAVRVLQSPAQHPLQWGWLRATRGSVPVAAYRMLSLLVRPTGYIPDSSPPCRARTCTRICTVASPRTDADDTTGWGDVVAVIEVEESLGAGSLAGLADYSHVEVLVWLDQVRPRASYANPTHPRGEDRYPRAGVFAGRGPNRPNPLGVTVCRLLSVAGRRVTVAGLDAVDGTPVVDLKPVLPALLPSGPVVEPAWSRDLMHDYWVRDRP